MDFDDAVGFCPDFGVYKPTPLSYPDDHWVHPLGERWPVPKTLKANADFRIGIYKEVVTSLEMQKDMIDLCARSPIFFLNTFAMTYRPKQTCIDGRVRSAGTNWVDEHGKKRKVPQADAPVITWPAQDEMIEKIHWHLKNGGTLLIDKSREQGATVICMYMLAWAWLFVPRFSALVISRKKDLVDSPAEDSLFGKIDYMMTHVPEFILPNHLIRRTRGNQPHIINKMIKSRIVGETSNKDVGQSMRVTCVFVDEAARFPDGKALMKSITSVAACYLLASTPNGPGTEFSKIRNFAMSPKGTGVAVSRLGYWNHPQMGRDRFIRQDADGSVTGVKGQFYWETPAFEYERSTGKSAKDIRENWLIDHDTSGLLVLDANSLAKMRDRAGPPKYILDINPVSGEVYEDPKGRLKVWIDLDDGFALPVDDNYVNGWDIAQGVESSNTIGAVMSRTTGMIVAEWADSQIPPHEAAHYAHSIGLWSGGQRGTAFVIWERNGPGIGFGHELVGTGYTFLYYQRLEGRKGSRKTRQWGWHSTPDTKELLFKELNKGLMTGQFATRCPEGIEDMASWIFDEHGRILCGTVRDENTGAQARHGDRAIAYGLCNMGRKECAEFEPAEYSYATGTLGRIADHAKMHQQAPEVVIVDPFKVNY